MELHLFSPICLYDMYREKLYLLLLLMEACTHVNANSIFIQIHKFIIQIQEVCLISIGTRYGLEDRTIGVPFLVRGGGSSICAVSGCR
jgi:hypothetical protein